MSLFDSASLVVTPSGYKEDKLYSIKPTDGSGDLVVTRATTATRVNSAGLIESVPYNLITYSQDFDNADWSKNNCTVTANATTAPNGTLTADFIVSTSTTETGVYKIPSVEGQNVWSVYAKKGTGRYLVMNTNAPLIAAKFDLETGQIVGTPSTGATASIESVGSGWYRCIISSSTSTNRFTLFITNNTTTTDFTSSVGLSVYLWGAQLVQGTSAKEYFPTTDRLNVPRLDYTNSSCPSILVEPQRTNILSYSEQFDNAVWGAPANVIANTVVSPDGTTTGDTLTGGLYRLQVFSSITYVFSFYAKKNAQSTFSMRVDAPTNQTYTFNLDTGTADGGCSMVNVGNGWYRCFMPFTSSLTGTGVFYPNVGGNNFYIWGAQLEAGSYATSYIPTVASTVTRNTDNIYKTGISSLIGQTEGTVFIDFIWNQLTGVGSYPRIIELWKDSSNYIQLFNISGTQTLFYEIYNGGVVQFSGSTTMNLGANKIALAYKLNDCVIYKNGTLIATDTVATIPTLNDLGIFGVFNGGGGANLAASLKSAQLYKTRLTNTELASVTTI